MKTNLSRITLFALVAIALTLTTIAAAQDTETVLFNFNGTDGSGPNTSLVRDSAGDFYGAAQAGGNAACAPTGCGVIFKLSNSTGTWVETVIHSFTGGADGSFPVALILSQGNLFGVAELGGTKGFGEVFKMAPNAGGWGFRILHSFPASPSDGTYPDYLAFDAVGNLYGAAGGDTNTTHCPASGLGCGLVYKLTPTQAGPWKETVLHRFQGAPSDGNGPGAFVFDSAGNLVGLAGAGGAACPNNFNIGCGTVYQLTPTSSGPWTETTLHTFNGNDGSAPYALLIDSAGNLFGTAFEGGIPGCNTGTCGVVFELSPNSSGGWSDTTIHKFNGAGDGNFPSSIAFDAAGNLYSSTEFAGPFNAGTVIELSPNSGGTWSETVLFDFPTYTDGGSPAGLFVDSSGNIFGTAFNGGDKSSGGDGLIFRLTP
jgi:uncharacterized repeat protein (TIGR03803 family)